MKLPHNHSKEDKQTISRKIIHLNEDAIKGQIKDLVRGSVEETLNELLKAEPGQLLGASKFERNEERQGYRSGHYSRNLTTIIRQRETERATA